MTDIKPWEYDVDRETRWLNALKKRYFSESIKYPSGDLRHHFDCGFYRWHEVGGIEIKCCTCGFLHDLKTVPESLRGKLHCKYYEELAWEEGPRPKRTPEEVKADRELFESWFGNCKTFTPTQEEWDRVCDQDWSLIEEVFGKEFVERKKLEHAAHEKEWEEEQNAT